MDQMRMYSLKELEGILHVTYRTLLRYVNNGKLKAAKIGGKWMVSEENLKRFVNGDGIGIGSIDG